MSYKALLSIIILIAVSFFIGLNIGLHGYVIIFHPLFNTNPTYIYSSNTILHPEISSNSTNKQLVEGNLDNLAHDNNANIKTLFNSDISKERKVNIPSSKLTMNTTLKLKLDSIDLSMYAYIKEHLNSLNSRSNLNDIIHEDIPIVLLTCNRPALLKNTLQSLLNVRGINKDNIIISQDGAMSEIAEIVKEYKLTLIQNLQGIRLRGGAANDGASRIAQHYKFSLTSVFDRKPNANALIIIEDDLLFSPDFYEYLQSTAPILRKDPSLFIISAWSDNGFINHVKDPYALRRTDYFPGLGWLLTKELYKNELESLWPKSHWDHWLRSPEISKNRAIVYPQIPRTYHNGIKGTFMDLNTHNKYFKDIGYNIDPTINWIQHDQILMDMNYPKEVIYLQAHKEVYDYRITQLTKICKHVTSVIDLIKYENELLCVWIDVDPNCEREPPVPFQPIAEFFQLWHEHRRGNYQGIHEFYWETNYILLINIYINPLSISSNHNKHRMSEDSQYSLANKISTSTYRYLIPTDIEPIKQSKRFEKSLLLESKRRKLNIKPTKASDVNKSCNDVCQEVNKICDLNSLQLLNNCEIMQQNFPCQECHTSEGPDQPVYIPLNAKQEFLPGHCLINSNPVYSQCDSRHRATIRLCSCI